MTEKEKPDHGRFTDEDGEGLIIHHPDGRLDRVIGKKDEERTKDERTQPKGP